MRTKLSIFMLLIVMLTFAVASVAAQPATPEVVSTVIVADEDAIPENPSVGNIILRLANSLTAQLAAVLVALTVALRSNRNDPQKMRLIELLHDAVPAKTLREILVRAINDAANATRDFTDELLDGVPADQKPAPALQPQIVNNINYGADAIPDGAVSSSPPPATPLENDDGERG